MDFCSCGHQQRGQQFCPHCGNSVFGPPSAPNAPRGGVRYAHVPVHQKHMMMAAVRRSPASGDLSHRVLSYWTGPRDKFSSQLSMKRPENQHGGRHLHVRKPSNFQFKAVVLGERGVGKTALCHALKTRAAVSNCDGLSSLPPFTTRIEHPSRVHSTHIFDVELLDRDDRNLGTTVFLYCYDASNLDTLMGLTERIPRLMHVAPKAVFVAVGTKSDLVGMELDPRAFRLAQVTNKVLYHINVSAKTGENMPELRSVIANAGYLRVKKVARKAAKKAKKKKKQEQCQVM